MQHGGAAHVLYVEHAVAVDVAVEGVAAYATAATAPLLLRELPPVRGGGKAARPRLLRRRLLLLRLLWRQRLQLLLLRWRWRGGGVAIEGVGANPKLQATPPPCRGEHHVPCAVSDRAQAELILVIAAVAHGARDEADEIARDTRDAGGTPLHSEGESTELYAPARRASTILVADEQGHVHRVIEGHCNAVEGRLRARTAAYPLGEAVGEEQTRVEAEEHLEGDQLVRGARAAPRVHDHRHRHRAAARLELQAVVGAQVDGAVRHHEVGGGGGGRQHGGQARGGGAQGHAALVVVEERERACAIDRHRAGRV